MVSMMGVNSTSWVPFSLDLRGDFVAVFHSNTVGFVKWAAKTEPRAKAINGADHQARGGPVQWSRVDGDTRLPTSSGLHLESA